LLVVSSVLSGILMELATMRAITAFFSALLVSATLLLSGCGGGGSVDVAVEVPPVVVAVETQPVQVADFSIVMFANGLQVPGINLPPGAEQDVDITAGTNFELVATGPVAWTVVVGGAIVNAPAGSTISYAGATIVPTLITNARYAASTGRVGFLSSPVVVSLIATSLVDSRQEAQINIVVNN
jgi:hypothetical protein